MRRTHRELLARWRMFELRLFAPCRSIPPEGPRGVWRSINPLCEVRRTFWLVQQKGGAKPLVNVVILRHFGHFRPSRTLKGLTFVGLIFGTRIAL